MMGMAALRFATLLALAVWIGGLLALGAVAAPAVFQVVADKGVPAGRVLSGAIVGEVLRRFHLIGYACGALILFALIVRAVLGPRPRRFAVRVAIAAIMLAASLYSGLMTSAGITRIHAEIGEDLSPSSLPAGDARRARFDRLHRQATLLHFVPLIGGLALLFWEMGD
jgi:putative copper export protein